MKKLAFIILLVFLHLSSKAQHDVYAGGQLDMGLVGKTSFENNTLSKKNYSPHLGGLLFVNIRMFDLITLEVGAGQHWNNTRFKDPGFERDREGFSVELDHKNYYWNYYAAISAMYKIGKTDSYLYGKLGYAFNVYGKKELSNSTAFAISRLNIDETITSSLSYEKSNQSFIPEIGIQQMLLNRNIISAGLKLNLGRSEAYNGSYTIRNNQNGESVSDNFSSLGNFASLTVAYNVILHHIPKRERIRRIPEKDKVLTDEISKAPKDTIPEIAKDSPKEVEDRKLVVTRKLKVHTATVKIMVWDHQTVDGDRVSINLNGKWILENYTLKKEKHIFEIELEEGLNTFVLHALNLGKYSPNTAAFIVKEGIKSHRVILESDLNESGTLEINYKKRKE